MQKKISAPEIQVVIINFSCKHKLHFRLRKITSKANIPNAKYKFVKCATKPIIAGHTKIPKYPSVVAAETAIFTGIIFCLPSIEKNIGTMFAVLVPIKKNPAYIKAELSAKINKLNPAKINKNPQKTTNLCRLPEPICHLSDALSALRRRKSKSRLLPMICQNFLQSLKKLRSNPKPRLQSKMI